MSDGFVSANPSVGIHGDERYLAVRTVNFRVFRWPKDMYSEIFLLRLSRTYDILSLARLTLSVASPEYIPRTDENVRGFEDPRLIYVRSKWWILANAYDREGTHYLSTMYLLELDQTNHSNVIAVHPLRFESFRPQKNWMPLVRDNESLYFLYWMSPVTVLQLEFESKSVRRIYSYPAPFSLVLFGSTPGVTYTDDGW